MRTGRTRSRDKTEYETKTEAVAAGRSEAQRRKTEHVIHNEDGSIGERNSYRGDPARRPG
jgi:uncharacterized protein DUF2188